MLCLIVKGIWTNGDGLESSSQLPVPLLGGARLKFLSSAEGEG